MVERGHSKRYSGGESRPESDPSADTEVGGRRAVQAPMKQTDRSRHVGVRPSDIERVGDPRAEHAEGERSSLLIIGGRDLVG